MFLLGFVPGFAYMGMVDPRIALPRLSEPRTAVPAGSVGIAGDQTGIYPRQTPGGWNVIGRTPMALVSLDRPVPSMFAAGDRVRFHAGGPLGLRTDCPRAGVRTMSGGLSVLTPGLLTTVQDSGRWGQQSIGVSVSGPMDPFAHRLGNALAGNTRDAATLEVTLTGPSVRFDDARVIAVAGARFELFLDDVPVPHEQPVVAHAGAVLRFGARQLGARAYLGVSGGIDVPLVLGSRATHVPTATGGWQGRPLRRGDYLPLGLTRPLGRRVASHRPLPIDEARPAVRVMAGPDIERFAPDAFEALVSAPYHVGVDSDRMGFRLNGPLLRHRGRADILSDATTFGTLQVPASGQPVLLMADRQTTGGYARLATVITADLGIAGQAAPGDALRFVLCDRAEALRALVGRERPLLALEGASA